MSLPSHARVVVIGGGIAGASTLYHLTELGCTDAVLLERDELTAGSTWHAAGNCPDFSTSPTIMRMQHYSTQLYAKLAGHTEAPLDYHVTGSIRLAHGTDRMEELGQVCSLAQALGIDFELLTPNDIRTRHPFLALHDLKGALWDPGDGDIDPSQITQALARAARAAGAKVFRHTPVIAITRQGDLWAITTSEAVIRCDVVVNAAGYRVNEVAAMAGRQHPVVAMEHQYLVTEAVPELVERGAARLPLVRDPDVSYYLRQERHGLILGPYERDCKTWAEDGIPAEFGMELLPQDLDRLEPYINDAMRRLPLLAKAGIQRVINGPIPYTPDGLPLIGPVYGLNNFYVCAAFSFGIVQGGGAGKIMAEIILHGQPEWDAWAVDPRRYTDYAGKRYVVEKAVELYANEYAISYPFEERPAGRPARTSPLYPLLQAKGARFGARAGWERAIWFPPAGMTVDSTPSHHRGDWFATVGEECRRVRERLGLLDLCGMAKFLVNGPAAAALLDRLICGRLPEIGHIGLAYCCTERGGLRSALTVTRLAADTFYLVSAAAAEWHDHQYLSSQAPASGVTIANLTSSYGTLVLAGPQSRAVLSKLTRADLSNGAFPWLSARRIPIGFTEALALRISYTGELGWELHLPSEYLVPVYQELMAAGNDAGICDFGIYALDSLRLEKGYPAWRVDLSDEYTPFEYGLERFVVLDKGDFIGREALRQQRKQGISRRLVALEIDTDIEAPAYASVFAGDRRVGLIGSSGYGHVVTQSIALAMVAAAHITPKARLEVDIYGKRRAAQVVDRPLYDPHNQRPQA